ncbi:MAG: SulP family inorganic anion transporter [Polyangiaceae bacterium]|nr:SulP family inorganic anion transporter [Polyangiaceae bacterium]
MERLRGFMALIDNRFEDLDRKTWKTTVYRDFSAGLVVALTAIPMAMGFAMAMGLRPEQGIIAGALACIVGRTFGGSKYQVYGPTAAFIPVVAGLMNKYGESSGGTFASAHGFLVLASIIAGIILMICGMLGLGKHAKLVPPSIVVGFTVGIAVSIALSNGSEALGMASVSGGLVKKVVAMVSNIGSANLWALVLAAVTFFMTRLLLKVSIFIPAPLLALGACTLVTATVLSGQGIALVGDRYGSIPNNFFVFTGPSLPGTSLAVFADLAYFVIAIVFVSGVESLLCSSMADRLANNKKTPFNPDKEFWGQGLVQIITPLVNGFPCTGALARTATSIKAGAVTPLAGYFKGVLKLAMAYFMAPYLEKVPMACIAGILLWVASNMIKKHEIKEVMTQGRFHTGVMIFTAVMVPVTDFLTGVISALVVHFALRRFFEQPASKESSIIPVGAEQVGADAE